MNTIEELFSLTQKQLEQEKVNAVCPLCGKEKIISKKAFKKNLILNGSYRCVSCSQKGKKISEEHKQKISSSLSGKGKTIEHKNSIKNYFKEKRHDFGTSK